LTGRDLSLTQTYQHLSKYARWREQDGRRETYAESVDRAMFFLGGSILEKTGYRLTLEESGVLWNAMKKMTAFPSLRLFQMAGPAAQRCNVSIYNCSYRAISSVSAFSEILYILMQGTGVGFSVERQFVDKLPYILPHYGHGRVREFRSRVEDTTEGWCDALKLALNSWFNGVDMQFKYDKVRPAGARLKTKGGWASGPEPLRSLLAFCRDTISKHWAVGGRLSPLEAHDIVCKIGEVVVVGGVRRSALLSLFDLDDREMLHCKDGRFWETHPWRAMANNSAVYAERPTWDEFGVGWDTLRDSGTGEPGVWNRGGYEAVKPDRRGSAVWGVNPCGEIALRNQGLCNLSRAIARPGDTAGTLGEKVRIAAIFGTLQSALTDFGYLPDEWRKNAEEERLLGVTIDGAMDCEILRPGAFEREYLLELLRSQVQQTNMVWSAKLGINPSAACTTMQPGGNGPQLFGCSSGMHTRYAPFYIRRFRASFNDPLSSLLIDRGVGWSWDLGGAKSGVVVFDFPVASPDGSLVRSDLSALDQFNNWLVWKKHYTEHNPSITIYVKPDEWEELGRAVYDHWDYVGGLSFLPADGGIYELAPYEAITEERYRELVAKMPAVDFGRLSEYEKVDGTNTTGEVSCVAGACEL
jgi:ribonucleoside-triphosphate reductase (thioredoxin)